MAIGSIETVLMGTLVALLFFATTLMLIISFQLRAMRGEAALAREQLAKMDWGPLLMTGVRELREAAHALEEINKRLQKLEEIEKVQLSHINVRAGR